MSHARHLKSLQRGMVLVSSLLLLVVVTILAIGLFRSFGLDEKIAGSIHFTPGSCYDEASNGNKSGIHWDMVMRQTPEVGGGEVHFDGKPIRRNGMFLPKSLSGLNPENLK